MSFTFVQRNVSEEINTKNWKKPDFEQARAVLEYKPDVIIFEKAFNGRTPNTVYNRYVCANKPVHLVREYQRFLNKQSKNYGDALSGVPLWDNILKLWKDEHNVQLYNVDGSDELRREFFEVWKYMYPCALKNWLWWVRIYLREKYMADHVTWVLDKHKSKDEVVVAIFLQSFHWEHVEFLLTKPTKAKVWEYYFNDFKGITRSNITEKIKAENRVFYKHWLAISGFV